MNPPTLVFLVLALVWNASAAPFQNLGFDNANTNNVTPRNPPDRDFFGPASEVVPGWQLLLGTSQESEVGLNALLPGPGYSSIMTSDNQLGRPVVGLYSLSLIPFYGGADPSQFRPYTLIQNGDIPLGSLSMRFINYGAPVDLYVNGSLVPLFYDYGAVVPDPNARLANVSGDISAFAGQNVELRLVTLFRTTGAYVSGLDSISFSAIPEPSAVVLLTLGVLLLFAARRVRPR